MYFVLGYVYDKSTTVSILSEVEFDGKHEKRVDNDDILKLQKPFPKGEITYDGNSTNVTSYSLVVTIENSPKRRNKVPYNLHLLLEFVNGQRRLK